MPQEELLYLKVQIEKCKLKIFIFQLFHTFHGREEYCISSESLAQARRPLTRGVH